MHFDKPVSREFLDVLLREYPVLRGREDLTRLAGAILFPALIDEASLRPVVSTQLGALCEGVEATDSYRAAAFFEEFRASVFDFRLSGWNYFMGKARELISTDVSPALRSAVAAEIRLPRRGKDRLLTTGSMITRRVREELRWASMEAAASRLATANPVARQVAGYMNQLPPNSFTSLLQNLDVAEATADLLPAVTRDYNRNVLASVGNLLSQPIYGPSESGRTARIFPAGTSINTLSRSVRRAVCGGLTEIDIAHTHFALNAHIWGCQAISDYLASTSDLWGELVTAVAGKITDPILFEVIKGEVKVACYSIFYGAKVCGVSRTLTTNLSSFGVKRAGRSLLRHPLIATIVRCREAAYSSVSQAGGATDCFGTFIATDDDTGPASVLSQVAQALELFCMSAVIDLAEQTDDFAPVLWMHDGATVRFSRRPEANSRRICEAIQAKALTKGISLRVTVKNLP